MDFAGPMPMVPGMAVPERARRPTFAPPLPAAAASGSSDTVRDRDRCSLRAGSGLIYSLTSMAYKCSTVIYCLLIDIYSRWIVPILTMVQVCSECALSCPDSDGYMMICCSGIPHVVGWWICWMMCVRSLSFLYFFCIGAFYCFVLCWLDGFAVDYLLICQTKESITPWSNQRKPCLCMHHSYWYPFNLKWVSVYSNN